MLVASRDVEQNLLAQIRFQLHIRTDVVPRVIACVGGRKAGEHRRARWRQLHTILVQVTAVDPGSDLTRDDLVVLPPVCPTKRHRDRIAQPELEWLGYSDADRELSPIQA